MTTAPFPPGKGVQRVGVCGSAGQAAWLATYVRGFLALLLLWTGTFSLAQAQSNKPYTPRWSTQPEEFVTQLTNMMRLSKVQASVDVADQFGASWGNLTAGQQQSIMAAAAEFDKRRYRALPYYQAMMELVVQASQSLGSDKANMDGLMDCLAKTAVQEPPKNLVPFCDRVKFFLVNQALYFNKFYTLRVSQAPFSFEYVGQSAEISDTIPATPPESTTSQQKLDEWGTEPAPVMDPAGSGAVSAMEQQGPDVVQPGLEGAVIRFAKVDLTLGTGYDSTTLYNTSGAFMISKNHWVGEGGRFDWTVAGLEANEAYVDLDKYNFRVVLPHILAENATLHYDSRLTEPVKGAFEFRSVKHASPEVNTYPRFISYNAVSAYKNLGDDVTLTGGFSLQGRKINTSAVYLGKSTLTIRHRNNEVFRGISRRFELDSNITSAAVYSVLPRGLDSITQANARLVYERNPERRIKLYKNVGKYKEAPFFDSYFRTEITCEALFYTLDSNKIDFYNQSNRLRTPVVVESMDYFTTDRYADVQGINKFSPIGILVANYNRTNRNPHFYADEIAEFYKLKPAQVRASMLSLAEEGFIEYDPITGEGELGNKLKHYYSSMKKMKDYDYIAILSIAPERMNARIDLDSNILFVYGVDKFSVNDSLGVYIKPKDRTLKLLQNRDFQFNGEISAGNFVVNGEKFLFNYNFYQVDLTKIDSIDVLPDARLKTQRARAKNASRLTGKNYNAEEQGEGGKPNYTSGVLFINKPDNKSNAVSLPQYPIFDVQAPAYVYFDKPNILKGAYNKRVYFYVPPFKVDSISGPNLAAISFNGSFHSDDIFPEFEERLIVRPDKTLGFEHHVPTEGYQLYKGPGKFFGDISLDGKGLRGKGEIKYLTTTVKSDDFIFYQDSVVAKGQTVFMEKGTYGDSAAYPDANVTEYNMKWLTKADTMYLTNAGKTPWYFYNKRVRMNGTLAINEKGAFGSGIIKASGSRAESPAYSFKQDRLSGRNAFFEVQSDNPVKPAFACKNVKFDFFVDQEYAEFSPEEEGFASNEFPFARYKTSIPKAVWDLKKKTVTMTKPEGADLSSSIFYSTLPDQDSLNFQATGAVYDIAKSTLNISGVPFIYVADGMIIPDSGRVEILENAEMTPLKKAVLVLDTINKYHRLIDATITVKSRYAFEGEATYLYVNTVNDTLPIRFDKFEFVEDKDGKKDKDSKEPILHTKSGGEIDEEKPLKIANGVLFKGTATMWANRPTLEFQGYVKLDLRKTDTEWLKYESTGESKEFVLDLKSAMDAEGNPVTTGLFVEDGSSELYGVFVNGKRTSQDHEVFSVTGVMNFNSETKEFRVGSADRLAEKTTEGNIFAYNDSTGRTSFEGRLHFLNKETKEFSILASGAGVGVMDSADFDINTLLELEMALPAKAFADMVKVINQRAKDIGFPEAMGDREVFAQRLTDMLGKKTSDEFKKGGNKPVHTLVSRFAKGMTFTDLGLKWSKKQAAFYTPLGKDAGTEDKFAKLNLLNILNSNINAQVGGYLEIKKADGLDLVTLYIEASPDAWWYFSFDDQMRLAATSSMTDFVDAVQEKSKGAKPGSFYLEAVDETEKNNFLKHFRQDYLGQKINEADYEVKRKDDEVGEPSDDAKPEGDGEPAVGEKSETDEYATDEEKAAAAAKKKKKGKKDKKKAEGDQPAEETPAEEGFGDEPKPDEVTKKADGEAPAEEGFGDEPAKEETAKKKKDKKKKDKKKKKSEEAATEEQPAEEGFGDEPKKEEEQPAKKKKSTKKEEEAPAKEEPAAEEGFGDEPKKEEPAKEEPKKEEPKTEAPAEQPAPKADTPKEEVKEEPKAEEPKAEPAVGEPAEAPAEEPKKEEMKEEPKKEEAAPAEPEKPKEGDKKDEEAPF